MGERPVWPHRGSLTEYLLKRAIWRLENGHRGPDPMFESLGELERMFRGG